MILVDHATGSIELLKPLQDMGLPAIKEVMPFGDFAWEGRGVGGKPTMVGIELKTVNDLVSSLRTGRLEGHQLPGLVRTYDHRWLVVEGEWRVNRQGVLLVRGARGAFKPIRGNMTYMELEKRLLTLEVSGGLRVRRTVTRRDTLLFLGGAYRWWTDTDLDKHKSHLVVYDAPSLIPVSDFRQVVMKLPGIGRETSRAVEEFFGADLELAFSAGQEEWEAIEGVGEKTARRIQEFIHRRG